MRTYNLWCNPLINHKSVASLVGYWSFSVRGLKVKDSVRSDFKNYGIRIQNVEQHIEDPPKGPNKRKKTKEPSTSTIHKHSKGWCAQTFDMARNSFERGDIRTWQASDVCFAANQWGFPHWQGTHKSPSDRGASIQLVTNPFLSLSFPFLSTTDQQSRILYLYKPFAKFIQTHKLKLLKYQTENGVKTEHILILTKWYALIQLWFIAGRRFGLTRRPTRLLHAPGHGTKTLGLLIAALTC